MESHSDPQSHIITRPRRPKCCWRRCNYLQLVLAAKVLQAEADVQALDLVVQAEAVLQAEALDLVLVEAEVRGRGGGREASVGARFGARTNGGSRCGASSFGWLRVSLATDVSEDQEWSRKSRGWRLDLYTYD
ncbi:uncharacterized protein H6S33_001914 [Morchella sextelata]|uniref:uncharacterized protein n=1 Tax=Morchella sextelata TaxID=1174677 RepID=UPI001D03BA8D|nr:uncharacterized protein H6S33_001914 [Morchella sextelata]KAH0607862.1 hypothetical protein H6S33_001914 [Morchella sextelata]